MARIEVIISKRGISLVMKKLSALSSQKVVQEELNVVGKDAAKKMQFMSRKVLADKKVNYSGTLSKNIVVRMTTFDSYMVSPIGVDYALGIETGDPLIRFWRAPLSVLNKWRKEKLGEDNFNPNKPFVSVGNSGGANRVTGVPYDKGAHFMKKGFRSIASSKSERKDRARRITFAIARILRK